MNLADIDKNFKIKTTLDREGIRWLNTKTNDVFSTFGIMQENGKYTRMPAEAAKKVSENVSVLANHTAGGRICFETDSPYVAISTKGEFSISTTMTNCGHFGFDLFTDDGDEMRFFGTFIPPVDTKNEYDSIIEFRTPDPRKILIHFPLYTNIDELFIGIDENSEISKFSPYKEELPIIYYGSSITQGGCASRPGNAYQAIVAQQNNTDFINLGFSGSARGERAMAEYIASLPMSVFVLDYDWNDFGTPDILERRHRRFYDIVRAKNPDIPIIIMSSPYDRKYEQWLLISRDVVRKTYELAKDNGDNVYFIDGFEIFGRFRDCVTVDSIHPNDFGFVKMAEAVLNTLEKIEG